MSAPTVDRRHFAKRPDSASLAIVASHLSFGLLPLYLAAWIGPSPILILLCIWFGATMHGLLNLMHEAAHGHVFRNRAWSFGLGRWFLSPLILTDFETYTKRHWQHHNELGMPGDTKFTYRMALQPRALVGFLLRCLFLAEALGKFTHAGSVDRATGSAQAPRSARVPAWLWRAGFIHAALAASLFVVASLSHAPDWPRVLVSVALAHGFVFFYGLASVTAFVAAIRSVAEHRIGLAGEQRCGTAALRNLRARGLSRLVFGCHGFAEHATHHAQPGIPSYRLPQLTLELANDDPRLAPTRGYLETCWALIRHEREADRATEAPR